MTKHQTCPACNSANIQVKSGFELHHLSKCTECNLHFCHLIPDDQHLESHYEDYGRDDYLSPITIKRYNEIISGFEKVRKTNKLLDIGCGIGFFLEEAKKLKWDVQGSEISTKAAEKCNSKGIPVSTDPFESLNLRAESFDVITSFEVIEHLKDLKKHIEKVYELLRPGGIFYLTTPNFNSLNRRLLGPKWNVLSYPEHLNYFNKHSLKCLMTSNGFKPMSVVTDGVSPGRILTSLKNTNVDHSSSEHLDEKLRRNLESNVFLKSFKLITNKAMNFSGLGENLKGSFIKL